MIACCCQASYPLERGRGVAGEQVLIWIFHAKLIHKDILPLKRFGYVATFDHWWASDPLNPSLSALLRAASKSISIQTAGAAADTLRNQMDAGLALLNGSQPSEISFLNYSHDPSAQAQHLFGASFGLSTVDLEAVRNDLDSAFYNGFPLRVTAYGGFSSVDPNPHSKQPTQDKFEAGFPLPLNDVSFRIEAQRA